MGGRFQTYSIAFKFGNFLQTLAWLHASPLVPANRQHVLLEHHLEHSNGLLTLFEAVTEAVKLDHISHRPCLTLNECFGVGYEVLGRRWFLLCVFIKADTCSNLFRSLFQHVTFVCHACFDARLELHALYKTFLESHACLLELD